MTIDQAKASLDQHFDVIGFKAEVKVSADKKRLDVIAKQSSNREQVPEFWNKYVVNVLS